MRLGSNYVWHFVLGFALVAFVFQSCQDAPPPPDDVALTWKTLMDDGDFEAAKAISTPRAVDFINFIQRLNKEWDDLDIEFEEEEEEYIPGKPGDYTVECTYRGSKARCTICCDDLGNAEEFDLVLIDGAWYVDLEFDEALEQDFLDYEKMMQDLEELLRESGGYEYEDEELPPLQ